MSNNPYPDGGAEPKCASCGKQWVNRVQPPWPMVTVGMEPYAFCCSWSCLRDFASDRAQKEAA